MSRPITLPLGEMSPAYQFSWLSRAGRDDVLDEIKHGRTPRDAVAATFSFAILEFLFADKPGFNVLSPYEEPLLRRGITEMLNVARAERDRSAS